MTQAAATPEEAGRRASVDLVRGLVIALMLLDHTREYWHASGFTSIPTDLRLTTPILFFTRFATHFCAPLFVFLAGVAVALQRRHKPRPGLARLLVTRGLWLIVLELTVIRALVFFDVDPRFLAALQVIWAIGISLILLAAFLYVPTPAVAAFALALIALHNLADGFRPASTGLRALWMVLHQPGPVFLFGPKGPLVFVVYPLVPWVGVAAAGLACGEIYTLPAERRRRLLIAGGAALLAAFVFLRAINRYGDPVPFAPQPTAVFTLLSFLNVTKYPPSLAFLLVTLGGGILLLGLLEDRPLDGRLARVLVTFGQVPLFFYLLQWPVAHLGALVAKAAAGLPIDNLFATPIEPAFRGRAGFPLAITYLAWLGGLALLYPACRWFAALKRARRSWWLSYL